VLHAEPDSARFVRAPGVLIEPVGSVDWAVFSALSGESHLLNETSAVVLELLEEQQPLSADRIVAVLAEDTGLPREEVAATIASSWETLLQAGLIRRAA
jgi:PqqD family protein of HPr-rel-A system